MQEQYIKSLQMIKYGKIKSVKQYMEMQEYFQLLSVKSLRYIAGKNFKDIIKFAEKIN